MTWNWGFLEHSDYSLKCNIFQTYYRVGALLYINRLAQQLSCNTVCVGLRCNVDQPNKVGLILKCTDSIHRFNVQIGLSHICVVWGLKYVGHIIMWRELQYSGLNEVRRPPAMALFQYPDVDYALREIALAGSRSLKNSETNHLISSTQTAARTPSLSSIWQE